METVLGVFRDLRWQYAVGVATLLGGALVFYFFDPRETEEERIRRQKRDAERAPSGSAKEARRHKKVPRQRPE